MDWRTVERPGYLGKKRDEIYSNWNSKFGTGNWRIAYQWGPLTISQKEAIQIYEDGYYEFFRNHPDKLEWIIKTASNVYDTAKSNINSGFDYDVQETLNNHIHDIAIRRAVMRNGEWFKGDHLVHVRWTDSEGFLLNPGIVKFHRPDLIDLCDVNDYGGKGVWWMINTIEDFYQRNKLLQIKESKN
jgi:hypothetical protein